MDGRYTIVHYKDKLYHVYPDGDVVVVVVRKNRLNPLSMPTYQRQLRSQTPIWRAVRTMASNQSKE